jgi:predicted nucleic acid-binding protein
VTTLADTSVFIAREQGRALAAPPPDDIAVSVVTVGELHLGVLMAVDVDRRALRLATLRLAEQLEPIPLDESVAHAWATLLARLRTSGRRMPINDSWIAATALARGMPVVTQDSDYDDVPGLRVVKV